MDSMSVHQCRQSMNPRKVGWCDCGHKLPDPPPTRPRNPDFERSLIEDASHGILDPTALIERCDLRASTLSDEYVLNPQDVALDRDRPFEVRQEIEDTFNHAGWWIEDNLDHPKALQRQASLKWLAAFYNAWSDEED